MLFVRDAVFFKFRFLSNISSFFLLGLGLYCAGVHNDSASYQWVHQWLGNRSYNILNFLSGLLIVSSILMSRSIGGFFARKIPVYLGKISFAAYLNHLLIIYVIGIPLFNQLHSMHVDYLPDALVSGAAIVVCTILFSELYYRFVDQSAMKLSNFTGAVFARKNT